MSKHTPGPWETGAMITRVEVWPEGWNAPFCVADCGRNTGPEEERCANAALISAAPDLLAACEVAFDLTDKWKRTEHGADFFEVDRVLRAAIAKARGEARACVCKAETHSPDTCDPNCGCPRCWDTWADEARGEAVQS